ncbi:GDSL-type esterase/lipase family protein [Variovorax sp. ZT4R33]|uniref:arylesterase n=1 Tax=Variovorax sp. ZT4R33 TaxID=3443743 RepID=UPI003F44F0B9
MNRRDFIAVSAALGSTGLSLGAFAQAPAAKPVILVVGDSLSAEYGLKRGEGWVPLLEKRLAEQKIAATVVNASISGDTTSGGRARLASLLKQHQPTHVVLELGGNDALRGLPIQNTEDNLTQMTKAAQAAGAKVLIVGMQVPPNYGGDYLKRFEAIFQKVATATKAAVVPFLLRGVADGPDAATLFQPDRIHPVAAAQPRMLDNVWPELKKLLGR